MIDPRNNDIVFVAATGSLWGPGGERGVYKTIDGGKNWKQVLKVDDDTGANDLVMDATNSQILYASTYQRRRSAVLHERRRTRQRHLEVDGWRRNLDASQRQRHSRMVRSAVSDSTFIGNVRNMLYALIEGPAPATGRGGRGAAPEPDEAPQQPGRPRLESGDAA